MWLTSCTKDESPHQPHTGTLAIHLRYEVDQKALSPDSLQYTNAAGNAYSVTRLQYYISQIVLTTASGNQFIHDGIFYVDALRDSEHTLYLNNVPPNTYTSIQFFIGLHAACNVSNSLPATLDNLNMSWPDVMGGGYHFLKLEGNYLNNNGAPKGYAVHLGTNEAIVLHHPLQVLVPVSEHTPCEITLHMNLNEWYTHPDVFNFNTDGNYTMGIPELMQKIAKNGKDIFHVE